MPYDVIEARHVGGFVLWLRFRDGTVGEIDLTAELYGPVCHEEAASLIASLRELRGRRDARRDYFASRVFTPRTAPAIMRLTAASASPPSSGEGMVANPIADAFGYRLKIDSNSAASCSLDGPFGTLFWCAMTSRGSSTSMSMCT